MDMKADKVKEPIVDRFCQGIQFLGKKIRRVYLFGSRARGTERPDSDYDVLLVVSGDFSLKDKDKVYDIVMDVLLDTGRLISLKIFREGIFRKLCKMRTPFMNHILTEGIQIG